MPGKKKSKKQNQDIKTRLEKIRKRNDKQRKASKKDTKRSYKNEFVISLLIFIALIVCAFLFPKIADTFLGLSIFALFALVISALAHFGQAIKDSETPMYKNIGKLKRSQRAGKSLAYSLKARGFRVGNLEMNPVVSCICFAFIFTCITQMVIGFALRFFEMWNFGLFGKFSIIFMILFFVIFFAIHFHTVYYFFKRYFKKTKKDRRFKMFLEIDDYPIIIGNIYKVLVRLKGEFEGEFQIKSYMYLFDIAEERNFSESINSGVIHRNLVNTSEISQKYAHHPFEYVFTFEVLEDEYVPSSVYFYNASGTGKYEWFLRIVIISNGKSVYGEEYPVAVCSPR